MSDEHNEHGGDDQMLAVAIITPVGTFPDEDDFRRAQLGEKIDSVLKLAADKLKLTNTGDWVATVDRREVNPLQTFREAKLSCVIEIEWHKREGGGGA